MSENYVSNKRVGKNYGNYLDQLPKDLLQLVIERLNYGDCVRIAAVCKPWRSILQQTDVGATPRVPWLLFHNTENCRLKIYDACERRFYGINLPESLEGGHVWGASKGWVLIAKGREVKYISGLYEAKLFLVDPISGIQIQLPDMAQKPFDENRTHEIKKILLSSADVSSSMAAVIFHRWRVLAICKLEEKSWTVFDCINDEDSIADIMFVDGILYVLIVGTYFQAKAKTGFATHVVKVGDRDVILKLIPWDVSFISFLVESDDAGLWIASYRTRGGAYEVFQITGDLSGNSTGGNIVNKSSAVGDRILFLTQGKSSSVPVSIFSHGPNMKCRFYEEDRGDYCERQHAMYHLQGKDIKQSVLDDIIGMRKTWFSPNIR